MVLIISIEKFMLKLPPNEMFKERFGGKFLTRKPLKLTCVVLRYVTSSPYHTPQMYVSVLFSAYRVELFDMKSVGWATPLASLPKFKLRLFP